MLLVASGCATGGDRPEGAATFAITQTPPDVRCVQITAVGSRAVSRRFPLAEGQSTASLSLTGLPLGDLTFSGAAFSISCGAIEVDTAPDWIADPVTATVVTGPAIVVHLEFRRNGQASAIVDFVDCRDGVIEAEEQCDDGNFVSGDGCSNTCLVEAGYQCSGEPSTCTPLPPPCGNGIVEGAEECDAGAENGVPGSGCSLECTTVAAVCGNGIVEGAEECDAGVENGVPGIGCSLECTSVAAVCGNGITEAGEQCDLGAENGAPASGCSAQCTAVTAACGDGVIESFETCEDGNTVAGDGCSPTCTTEPGFACSGAPSTCVPLAGFPQIKINEVDYDQPGTDATEFAEIYNAGAESVDLGPLSLVFQSAQSLAPYLSIPLATAGAVLLPGQYLVVAAPGLAVAPEALVIRFTLATNDIQNGPADGIAIVTSDVAASYRPLVDALSYEGDLLGGDAVLLIGGISYSLVEGNATNTVDSNVAPASLVRMPDGADRNDAASDWKLSPTPTPGAPNQE
jgi:cysteine-rich repeat protein